MRFFRKVLTGRPKEGFKPESWDEIATSGIQSRVLIFTKRSRTERRGTDQFKTHVKGQLGGREHIRPHEREYLELATAQHGMTDNETQCEHQNYLQMLSSSLSC